MHPEQRRFLRAIARGLPWALAAGAAMALACLLLGAPRWAASIAVPLAASPVPLVHARAERRAMVAAARGRGAGPLSRGLVALAAAHVALPLVGVPLAVEGLRSGNRPLAVAGTSLLAFVVLDGAILLPWHAARRQRRARSGGAASRTP
jgi:hypothetical protein